MTTILKISKNIWKFSTKNKMQIVYQIYSLLGIFFLKFKKNYLLNFTLKKNKYCLFRLSFIYFFNKSIFCLSINYFYILY